MSLYFQIDYEQISILFKNCYGVHIFFLFFYLFMDSFPNLYEIWERILDKICTFFSSLGIPSQIGMEY